MADRFALVLAGGSGRRFGAAKQFELLGGTSLVERSVELARAVCDGVVLVVPPGHEWTGPAVERTVAGGATHAESTRRGCEALPEGVATVLVTAPSHPLVTVELARQVLDGRDHADAVAPLLDVADVIRRRDGSTSHPTPGGRYGILQLPFALNTAILLPAVGADRGFVEEFSLVERAGGTVATVPGDPANLHITTPADLVLAEEILAGRATKKGRKGVRNS